MTVISEQTSLGRRLQFTKIINRSLWYFIALSTLNRSIYENQGIDSCVKLNIIDDCHRFIFRHKTTGWQRVKNNYYFLKLFTHSSQNYNNRRFRSFKMMQMTLIWFLLWWPASFINRFMEILTSKCKSNCDSSDGLLVFGLNSPTNLSISRVQQSECVSAAIWDG